MFRRFLNVHRIILLIFPAVLMAGYPWPLSPMNEQHRISATFGECREDRDHFHDGVDIPLAQGGSVLASRAGTVISYTSEGTNSYIRVGQFAYVHVVPDPALDIGDYVQQGEVVGITNNQNHIHFKDGGGGSGYPIRNALRSDGLNPFSDPYKPNSPEILLYPDGSELPFPSNAVSGYVDIVAHASDVTDLESPIDMNNGIYRIGYAIYDADTAEIVQGPYLPYTFLDYPPSSAIRLVYFRGSSTSEYYYTVTNTFQSNGYWDTTDLEPGEYVIAIFSYDIKMNADTTYRAVTVTDQDLVPPSQPELEYVLVRNDSLVIKWIPVMDDDLAGYRLYFSFDGTNWSLHSDENDIPAGKDSFIIPDFTVGHDIYFYLTAVDNSPVPNESFASDKYGVYQAGDMPFCLIVDGFDRMDDSWTLPYHDMAVIHGKALSTNAARFFTCSNDAIINGSIDLRAYNSVFWILGDEGVADYTFTSAEQEKVKDFLESGGNFFVSGSEIGYDLYAHSEYQDSEFYTNYLKSLYIADDANDYSVEGVAGSLFDGLVFTYGETPYEENYPDVIAPSGGSQTVLLYDNDRAAAIAYTGTFGQSTVEGRLVYLAFPFETITGEENRNAVMERVLQYFNLIDASDHYSTNPLRFKLESIFPNPFNSNMVVRGKCEPFQSLKISIFNLLGEEVWSELILPSSGDFLYSWNGRDKQGDVSPSGIYLVIAEQNRHTESRRVTHLK